MTNLLPMQPSTGATAFLQQAHRNNWQRYLTSLRSDARRGWDICVLTASDERQADMYRRQLDWRRAAGLLPAHTEFRVIPDPAGQRIGSGGATLRALAHVTDARFQVSDPRFLIIHSGGDSKRLPHCAAVGKLFARVPHVLPDGRASTIFDEFLIGLSGLAEGAPAGALVASGDVLLIFDHLQLSFRRGGVIGVAAAAPAEMGLRHGVYASGDGGHRVVAYLHKPAAAALARWGALAADGTVPIDTGLVWLDLATAHRLINLAQEAPVAAAALNLYGDLLLPLAESTRLEDYLADTSDGPATPAVQAARRVLWEGLRGVPFGVERLQPAVFVHFGSSREYWHMAAGDAGLAELCGWQPDAAAWRPAAAGDGLPPLARPVARSEHLILINSAVTGSLAPGPEPALVADCRLAGPLAWHGPVILSGVDTAHPLALAPRLVLDQWPVAGGRFVTRLFGLTDDPKRGRADPAATFVNRPWAQWLAAAGLVDDALWPDVPLSQRSLWNARLFPALADREASLALALPLQDPAAAPPDWRTRWAAAPRLSLAESFATADGVRLLGEMAELEHAIAARRFVAAAAAETPARDAAPLLGTAPAALRHRADLAAELIAAADPEFRLRAYKALTVASGNPAWEDRAFAGLADMIKDATVKVPGTSFQVTARHHVPQPSTLHFQPSRVCAAARIDFGGGWTDTPPYSIERGGTVLNAAITLRGEHPISAAAEPLPQPRLILVSRDIDAAIAPTAAGEVLAYANPADPFALHKAALVLRGIVPADSDPATPLAELLRPLGCGLRLTTATTIPRGSGLGTSSILAGVVLASLQALLASGRGNPAPTGFEPAILFDEVLYLEQMLTTGGGWQDQVGGLTGGIKLVTSAPGLPQQVHLAPTVLAPETAAALADRLVMVYTGQQRLAKDLLRAVMGRWMARDPEMVWIQAEIARLAVAMRDALLAGDLDAFGALLGEHWLINKRMDPGCTNPFIDGLFRVMGPHICGGKLAGAGGGGFVSALARSRESVSELAATLAAHYPGTPVAIWPAAVPEDGLQVQG